MKKKTTLGVLALATIAAVGLVPAVASATGGSSQTGNASVQHSNGGGNGAGKLRVVGLADGGTALVHFETAKPGKVRGAVGVTGLTGGDTRLIGIDYRVQDGHLYGVGDRAAGAGVYRIDAGTGLATLVTRLTVALTGSTFGVDFNPAANALRITSDSGQNLRQPFATAGAPTVADGALSYAAPAIAPGINGAAYTNNDLDPNTATTLFDLDTALNQIAVQSPANAGSLAPTGMLGVDAGGDTGFDIYSTLRDGTTVGVTGFAAVNGSLYEIALLSGTATSRGTIGAAVTDIALPLDQR